MRTSARTAGERPRPALPVPGRMSVSSIVPTGSVVALGTLIAMALPRVPGPWVEQCGRYIREQDRHQHGDRDQQEERLHQRIVLVVDSVEQPVADALVVE